MTELQDLVALLRADTPLILIETRDEARVVELFRQALAQVWRGMYRWSITEGLRRFDLDGEDEPQGPCDLSSTLESMRESLQRVRTAGLRTWVEESMDSRLGSEVSAGQRAWWIDLMASTDERAVQACLDVFASLDLRHCLSSIVAPTLFVTANRNALMAMEGFKTWAAAVSQARLVVLDADCYHPAAVKPQECVAAVLPHMDAAGRQEG